jgi:hypothetical protein
MSWLPAKGYVIFMAEADWLFRTLTDDATTLVRILSDSTREWRVRGVSMLVIMQGDLPYLVYQLRTILGRSVCAHSQGAD